MAVFLMLQSSPGSLCYATPVFISSLPYSVDFSSFHRTLDPYQQLVAIEMSLEGLVAVALGHNIHSVVITVNPTDLVDFLPLVRFSQCYDVDHQAFRGRDAYLGSLVTAS